MFHEELKTTLEPINKCDLARTIDVHRDTVAKWMTGKQIPSVSNLVRLCQYIWSEQWEVAYIRWSVIIAQQQH